MHHEQFNDKRQRHFLQARTGFLGHFVSNDVDADEQDGESDAMKAAMSNIIRTTRHALGRDVTSDA